MSRGSMHVGDGKVVARPVALTLVAAAFASAILTGGGRAAAQGTPEANASPAGGPCITLDTTAPASTPMAEGTPEAESLPATPAATDVEDAVVQAAQNFVNCWNANDLAGLASTVTPNFLESQFGSTDFDEIGTQVEDMGGLPPIAIEELGGVQSYDDGRVSLELRYRLGEYQVVDARHFFVAAGDTYLVDQEELIASTAEGDSAIISFTVAADAPIAFDQRSEIAPSELLQLHGRNMTEDGRTFLVVQLPAATEGTPSADEGLPGDTEFIGRLRVQAAGEEDLVLSGLQPGVYALVDTADGTFAPLTLAEPEA